MGWRDMSVNWSRTFASTLTWPNIEKKHLMKLEWLISLNSVLLLEATRRSCLSSSSAVGQGHLYISTESDGSRINWEGFYSEVPHDLFNHHLSNDSFTSMRCAVSAKVSLHIILFAHFKPIWGTYFGALLFPAEKKQWHSRFRYDDVLQALDSSSVSPFSGHIWCFKPSFQEFIKRFSWMIH